MKIKHKISLIYTIITAAILLVFAATIYISADKNREKEFYNSLYKEGLTKVNLLLDANLPEETLQKIYSKNREILDEVEVAIYNIDFELIYHDAVEIDVVKETNEMLQEIVAKKSIQFYENDWQVVGLLYNYNNKDYIVTAAAFDSYGFSKLKNLLNTLLISFFISLVFLYFAGLFLANRAFKPVTEMIDEAKKITATNLDLRINEGDGKDELSELAITFNEMLNRLEESFDAQKYFVSNIAHELRTPLSALMSELEWAISKKRSEEAYIQSIKNSIQDAQKLSRIITSLLNLAKASYDISNILFKDVRLDEILMEARTEVLKMNESYVIPFDIKVKKLQKLMISGNEYLLKIAFLNLMENACKFSENSTCTVELKDNKSELEILFKDEGIGIDKKEIDQIFKPFYRAENGKAMGSGIGLSLTEKIILLHKGNIKVHSKPKEGSTFVVNLDITQ